MSSYSNDINTVSALVKAKGSSWDPINPAGTVLSANKK
jgi:hypothetical protein